MAKAKILIVDDSASIVALIKSVLVKNDYEVVTAADGIEGLRVAKEIKPNLIILDVMLPKMDGYTVCRLLKFDNEYKEIRIIMLTAKAAEDDMKTGKQTGADIFLTKPFDGKVLLSSIEKLLVKI